MRHYLDAAGCTRAGPGRDHNEDAYLIDLCLVDPAMPAGSLNDPLDAHTPVTFIAPAQAVETQAARDPDAITRLREAIAEGWAFTILLTISAKLEPVNGRFPVMSS